MVSGRRPDAVSAGWGGVGPAEAAGRAAEAGRRLLVVRGRRRCRRGLQVASCRGAPPRQLERGRLAVTGLEAANPARLLLLLPKAAGPQRMLLAAGTNGRLLHLARWVRGGSPGDSAGAFASTFGGLTSSERASRKLHGVRVRSIRGCVA